MDNGKDTGVTNSVMVVNTLDVGRMDGTVALELAHGRTDDAIEVNGAMEWPTGRVKKRTRMEPCGTTDSGWTTNQSAKRVFEKTKLVTLLHPHQVSCRRIR